MPHGGREEKNNDLTVSRESTSERVAASCAAAIDWGGMASPETHRHLWLLSNSSCLCNFARYLSISINTPVVRLSKFCVPAPSFRSTGGGGRAIFLRSLFSRFPLLRFCFLFRRRGNKYGRIFVCHQKKNSSERSRRHCAGALKVVDESKTVRRSSLFHLPATRKTK